MKQSSFTDIKELDNTGLGKPDKGPSYVLKEGITQE